MRLLFASFLLLISSVVSADPYTWSISGVLPDGVSASDINGDYPSAMCTSYAQIITSMYGDTYSPDLTRYSDTYYRCVAMSATQGGSNFDMYRSGDTCADPGGIFDPDTGGCQICTTTIGQVLAARGPDSTVTVDGDGFRTVLPEPFGGACFTGCYYEVQSSFSDRLSCALVAGTTDTGFCNYRVTGNGDTCPSSDGVPADGGDPLNPSQPDDPDDSGDPDPGCPPPYVYL